jgi:hypothetical protein
MSDFVPFFLQEAVLSLYPMDAQGLPMTDYPVWLGAVANALRMGMDYEELLQASSGDRYQTAHHLDERHSVEIERTWLLRKPVLAGGGGDFGDTSGLSPTASALDGIPPRNQRFALEIVWWSEGYWYRRWYWGVTARSAAWDSLRTLHFGARQSWRAERFTEEGGYIPQPIYIPPPPIGSGGSGGPGGTGGSGGSTSGGTVPPPVTTPLPDQEQCVGFFHEAPLLTGAYLLGRYRWPTAVRLTGAQVVALAPQSSPVVLALEVGGVLTGETLTIPVGDANNEVTAQCPINRTVPALTDVRWKVVSAPDVMASAWVAALGMQADPA